jgi:glyoxylase-like metal-dependent hydrolase (beta-lactamase superfamily II)
MEKLTEGLWRWTARHPEWHPGEFGAEVACFAAQADDTTLLIDPLLPPDPEPVLRTIEGALGKRLAILITIPYHVRSSEELWRRYAKDAETTIHGHRACTKRLEKESAFRDIEPGVPLPGGVTAHTIGKPRRYEMPLHVPSHDALVFGDAVAETGGRLVVWATDRIDAKVERFYRERFNPTLEPLLELDFDSVLVTHGEPVLGDGKQALRKALRAKPWYHHG